jgi:hypothetical protein
VKALREYSLRIGFVITANHPGPVVTKVAEETQPSVNNGVGKGCPPIRSPLRKIQVGSS